MSDDSSHQVIHPSNTLQAKVSQGSGPNIDQIAADAESALEEIREAYEAQVREDIANMRRVMDQLSASGTAGEDDLKKIYGISHDIKGQGDTFGYQLLTQIGQSLCTFLKAGETVARNLTIIDAHIRAMQAVIGNGIRGDGGDKGRQLVDNLKAAAAQAA